MHTTVHLTKIRLSMKAMSDNPLVYHKQFI